MAWSYDATTLATTPKDQVRLLIGDTVSTDQQMQDEEITFLLSRRSSIYGAAAECCRSLQAKFSRSVDQSAGDTRAMYSQMAKAYAVKVREFESKAAAGGSGLPYAGGISESDKGGREDDDDRVSPQFQLGMMDNFLPVAPSGNESSTPDGDKI